jgi:hypothetical protein
LPFAAFVFALTLAGPVGAQDDSAKKRPAQPTGVTYDEAIRCGAFYLVFGSVAGEGSDEYKTAADRYDVWYDFSSTYYPTGFDQYHDADVKVEAERIDAELGQAADPNAAADIMAGYLNACDELETTELPSD